MATGEACFELPELTAVVDQGSGGLNPLSTRSLLQDRSGTSSIRHDLRKIVMGPAKRRPGTSQSQNSPASCLVRLPTSSGLLVFQLALLRRYPDQDGEADSNMMHAREPLVGRRSWYIRVPRRQWRQAQDADRRLSFSNGFRNLCKIPEVARL